VDAHAGRQRPPHEVACGVAQIRAQANPLPQSASAAHDFVQVPAWQLPSAQSEANRQTCPRTRFGSMDEQSAQSQYQKPGLAPLVAA
jgi:hypothetical protein